MWAIFAIRFALENDVPKFGWNPTSSFCASCVTISPTERPKMKKSQLWADVVHKPASQSNFWSIFAIVLLMNSQETGVFIPEPSGELANCVTNCTWSLNFENFRKCWFFLANANLRLRWLWNQANTSLWSFSWLCEFVSCGWPLLPCQNQNSTKLTMKPTFHSEGTGGLEVFSRVSWAQN